MSSHGWFRDDNGNARYRIQSGDTLGALARKYLGDGSRFMEIWNLQPASVRGDSFHQNNPNRIMAGEVFLMPVEAQATAVRLGFLEDAGGGGGDAPDPPAPPDPPFEPVSPPAIPVAPLPPMPEPTPPTPIRPASDVPTPPASGPSMKAWLIGGAVLTVGVVAAAYAFGGSKPAPSKALARRR